MTIEPLHDRVLARRVPFETERQGGIIIPDNAMEKPFEGTVIAVGGEEVSFIREDNILAVAVEEE